MSTNPVQFIEMDFDEWCETYKPIPNNIVEDSSFDGTMFETYGDEVAFVKKADPAYIWMYGDGDDGGTYIWNGWHIVNRIGYFITEVPCPPVSLYGQCDPTLAHAQQKPHLGNK